MDKEILFKKIEQIGGLTDELEKLLAVRLEDFIRDLKSVRAAERNFQLMVDLAADINTQILLKKGLAAPENYRRSFLDLAKTGIVGEKLVKDLVLSAGLRNILVNEYDFEEDYEKFYRAAQDLMPVYREYVKKIYEYAKG